MVGSLQNTQIQKTGKNWLIWVLALCLFLSLAINGYFLFAVLNSPNLLKQPASDTKEAGISAKSQARYSINGIVANVDLPNKIIRVEAQLAQGKNVEYVVRENEKTQIDGAMVATGGAQVVKPNGPSYAIDKIKNGDYVIAYSKGVDLVSNFDFIASRVTVLPAPPIPGQSPMVKAK